MAQGETFPGEVPARRSGHHLPVGVRQRGRYLVGSAAGWSSSVPWGSEDGHDGHDDEIKYFLDSFCPEIALSGRGGAAELKRF